MSSLISALPMGTNDHLKHLSSPHSLSTVSSPSATSNFSPLHTLNGYSVSGVSPTEASTASSFYPNNQALPPTAANMEMQPNTSHLDVKPSFSQQLVPPQSFGTLTEDSTQLVICSLFDEEDERKRQAAMFQKLKNSGLKTMSEIECRRQLYPCTQQALHIQLQLPYASTLRVKPPIPYPQPVSGPTASTSMPPPLMRPPSFASPSFTAAGASRAKKETKSKAKANANSRPPSNFSSTFDVRPSPSSSDGFAIPDLKRKPPSQSPSTSAAPVVKAEYDTTPKPQQTANLDRISREGDCAQCKKQVTNESPAIRCTALLQGCTQLYHMKCAGLNDPAVEELTRNPSAEWVCSGCVVSIKSYKSYRNA